MLILWASLVGVGVLPWLAVGLWGLGLVTTVAVNVGINRRTARTRVTEVAEPAWARMRRRWEVFQAVRSWAFLVAFVLTCGAVVQS